MLVHYYYNWIVVERIAAVAGHARGTRAAGITP